MPPQADAYHARLQQLADRTSARLTAAWSFSTRRPDAEGVWLRIARPILAGTAQSSVALSAAYVSATAGRPLPVSPLIIPDAVARVWEPFVLVSKQLGAGAQWADATAEAVDVVRALGTGAAMSTGRQALADQYPTLTRWQRQVNAGACEWCLGLSGVEWDSADAGSFGHPYCKCVNLPVGEVDNRRVLDAAGWDGSVTEYRKRDQVARLRRSEVAAMRRSREAAAEARRESDPARLERLSQREQDWETRAERAAERRRILETGTHRLAA